MIDEKDLINDLKERGMRVTPQRAIILSAIERISGHFTADELFSEVQKASSYISLATIYRTLDMLREMQLVSESHMGTSTTHYALKTHANHHHAICRGCQGTIELPEDLFATVVSTLSSEYNFAADLSHLVIFGLCTYCQNVAPQEDKLEGLAEPVVTIG